MLANGATIDGVRYRASFAGWTGKIEADGRVSVRVDPIESGVQAQGFIDCAEQPRLRAVEA